MRRVPVVIDVTPPSFQTWTAAMAPAWALARRRLSHCSRADQPPCHPPHGQRHRVVAQPIPDVESRRQRLPGPIALRPEALVRPKWRLSCQARSGGFVRASARLTSDSICLRRYTREVVQGVALTSSARRNPVGIRRAEGPRSGEPAQSGVEERDQRPKRIASSSTRTAGIPRCGEATRCRQRSALVDGRRLQPRLDDSRRRLASCHAGLWIDAAKLLRDE